jgi:hypothetical protein
MAVSASFATPDLTKRKSFEDQSLSVFRFHGQLNVTGSEMESTPFFIPSSKHAFITAEALYSSGRRASSAP